MARAAASRWTHRLVGGAFDAWLDATLKSRLSLELAGRVISRLTARAQAKAFGAWVANARANARVSRVSAKRLEAVVRRWSRRELRGAWDGWARAVAERARLRTVATRVARRFRRIGTAAAFETWWVNGVERPRMARAIVARVCERLVARAFHGWVTNARASARFSLASARAAGVARRLAARARAASFRAWREATKTSKTTETHGWTLARHMLARVLRGATRDAWDAWLAAARETKGNEANLKRCLTRKRVAQRWFLRWYWDAFDSDIQVALANILGAGEAAEAEAEGVGANEAGRGWLGMPSAVRGVRAVRRRDGDDESSSDSDTEFSDEDMSRASEAVAAQSAADAMLFSAPADPDGGFDVKEAARALARQSAMKSTRDPRSLFRRGANGEGEARASLSESESSETDSPSREARSPPSESYEARVARALREREALAKEHPMTR